MKHLVLLAAVAALVAAPVAAGRFPDGWYNQARHIAEIVEQQPGVANPTLCPWDTDDTLTDMGFAKLGPGETLRGYDCIIGDVKRRVATQVCAGKGQARLLLSLTVDVPTPERFFTKQAVAEGGCVTICFIGPAYPLASIYMQQIPGSNGGLGVPTTVAVEVTNIGKGKQQVAAGLYVSHRNSNNFYCGPYPGPQWKGDSTDPYGRGPVIQWAVVGE